MHTRAHIVLTTNTEISKFVQMLNSDGSTNKYSIENEDNSRRVDARSLLGVIYAATTFGDQLYLVNDSNDEPFPHSIDQFRAY